MKSTTTAVDAGVGRQVPITRRAAIRTGGLAALVAAAVGLVPTTRAEAAPLPPAANMPLIDRAEALLVELAAILPRLSERDVCNVGHNLDIMYRASEGGPERFAEWLADGPFAIGEGHRICDELDRLDALEAEAEARIESLRATLPTLPRTASWEEIQPVLDIHLRAYAEIEADLIVRHGEDGRRAFWAADDVIHARRGRERKEGSAA